MVHVADTGFGIPADSLENIFERFYRVKNKKTRYINGTGLAIVIFFLVIGRKKTYSDKKYFIYNKQDLAWGKLFK